MRKLFSDGRKGKRKLFDEDSFLNSFFGPMADLPLGIIVIDRCLTVRFFNAMAGYFIGIPPSVALGKPITAVLPDQKLSESLSSSIPYYGRHERINDRLIRSSLVPIEIDGQVLFVAQYMQDDSERIVLEDQLAELTIRCEMLDRLLDESFEEFGSVDTDGRVTYITRKTATNLGVHRDKMLGKEITSFNPKCPFKQVLSTRIPEMGEINRPGKRPVPVMVMPLFKNEQLVGAVWKSVFTDFLEANRFVRQLRKFEKRPLADATPREVSRCRFTLESIVGESKAILSIKQRVERVAKGDSNVLITGESGTGKEMFAQALHMASLRRNGPFVVVNCAGIPENLLESELFGYESGSFTGARKGGKPGKFELAHNGTLFLDEAGDMSMGMQAKLLRAVQEKEVERVGGTVRYEVDVRLVAATNKDLWRMVQKGLFREDLYYRLDVVNIQVPALRERLEDVPRLAEHFITEIQEHTHSNVKGVSPEVMELFCQYDWPGNVRELRNVIEGSMNLNTGELIDIQSLPLRAGKIMLQKGAIAAETQEELTLPFADKESSERDRITRAMTLANGNKRRAAKMLKISRASLYTKLKKYSIQPV